MGVGRSTPGRARQGSGEGDAQAQGADHVSHMRQDALDDTFMLVEQLDEGVRTDPHDFHRLYLYAATAATP
jgi:hypothetical protein